MKKLLKYWKDDQNVFRLIYLAKNYPELLSTDLENWDTVRRHDIWLKIGSKLSVPFGICRDKFNSLKSNYKRLNRIPEYRNGTKRSKFYCEMDKLYREYYRSKGCPVSENINRTTTQNSVRKSNRAVNRPNYNVLADDFSSISSTDHQETSTARKSPSLAEVPKKKSKTIDQYFPQKKKTVSIASQSMANTKNFYMFFNNMSKTTRKFPPKLQVQVKRMISDIIYDAEEQHLNEPRESL